MYAVERQVVAYITELERIFVDYLNVLKSRYLGKRSTVVECTVLYCLKSGGKNNLSERGEICKGVRTDGLDTLGNYNLGYIIVTDICDLCSIGIILVYNVTVFKVLGNVHIVGECILTDLCKQHIRRYLDNTRVHSTRSVVVVECRARSCIRVFNGNAYSL